MIATIDTTLALVFAVYCAAVIGLVTMAIVEAKTCP